MYDVWGILVWIWIHPLKVLRERFESLADVLNLPETKLRALIGEKPALLTKQSANIREAIKEARQQGKV
jgi:hypothetical protein